MSKVKEKGRRSSMPYKGKGTAGQYVDRSSERYSRRGE